MNRGSSLALVRIVHENRAYSVRLTGSCGVGLTSVAKPVSYFTGDLGMKLPMISGCVIGSKLSSLHYFSRTTESILQYASIATDIAAYIGMTQVGFVVNRLFQRFGVEYNSQVHKHSSVNHVGTCAGALIWHPTGSCLTHIWRRCGLQSR